ncbi:MAG TPA: CARDB domain-containing protein [Thermoanaerobaculia bacterium]|nr:CARDB domain-containing protein [Thermoanaerobaculia bacterium]
MRQRRAWCLAVFLLLAGSALAQPDLDVTYISRTPRYKRYVMDFSRGLPQLLPGTEKDKRWPAPGEIVTYRAHIINKGTSAASSFAYEWKLNGAVVRTGTEAGPFGPGVEKSVSFQTPWTAAPQRIEFKADPANAVTETFETNNARAIGSHDLTLSYWVERGMYQRFNNRLNVVGTRSFEDWLQKQIDEMNLRFGQAKYTPVAPNGVLDRVRIDKIVVAEDVDSAISPMAADPDVHLIDGRWQSSDGDPTNAVGKAGRWENDTNAHIGHVDWGLVHELAHQVGIIDLYALGIKNNEPPDPNGGVSVKDSSGRIIGYDALPLPVFEHEGNMGGGDTSPYNDGTYFESHTAAGMNAHAGQRRGHYGEYLFDTPATNRLRVVDDSTGQPIVNARVALYQKDYNTQDIDDAPEIVRTTNGSGLITLPNYPVIGYQTATGHTLKPNPFGQIDTRAFNGTMLARVTKGTGEGLAFFSIHDLNLAYWSGQKNEATHEIRVTLESIAAPLPNEPPSLCLIGRRTVAEESTLSFSVQASDPDGESLVYAAGGLPAGATFADQTFTWTPHHRHAGFHSVQFTVTDTAGLTDSETVLISVANTNAAPVAGIGPDQIVGVGAMVMLDGSGSSDVDRDPIVYTWRQTSGPSVTPLTNPRSATPTFRTPIVDSVTPLTFALTVSDATHPPSKPASVKVTIHPRWPATGNGQAAGVGFVNWTQSCSGVNRLLIVTSAEWRVDASSQVVRIDYSNAPLKKLGQAFNPETGALATMWYLVNPADGVLPLTAATAAHAAFGSSCWSNIAQQPPGGFKTATGTSATPSLAIPTDAESVAVVSGIATFGENPANTLAAGPGQFLLAHASAAQSRGGQSARRASAGSTVLSWTNSGPDGRWAMVGAALQPALAK